MNHFQLQEKFLNHYFTIIDLNYAIASLFVFFYLLSLKNKSQSSIHLLMSFFYISLMNLAYTFSSLFVDPVFRFHRWFSVIGSIVGTLHGLHFALIFPHQTLKKITKIILLIFYIIQIIIILIFIFVSIRSGQIFRFEGHFWDVNEYFLGQIVGVFILTNTLLTVSIQFKNYLLKKESEYRNAFLLFFIANIFVLVVPAIGNVMNRMFLITREEFQNLWGLSGIVGSFIHLVTYINYSEERNTILGKLFAISLTSLLVIIQFLNHFIINDREKLFDVMKIKENFEVIFNPDYKPEYLEKIYLIEIDQKDVKFNKIYSRTLELLDIDLENFKSEIAVILLQKRLMEKKQLEDSLVPYVMGYLRWREELLSLNPYIKEVDIINTFHSSMRKIKVLRSKIMYLKDDRFEEEFKNKILVKEKNKPIYKYFLSVQYKNKTEALNKIPILYNENQRIFFYSGEGKNFWKQSFVKYYYFYNNQLYLIIYNYKHYRIFISEIANILFILIILGSLIILSGYPYFFSVSILKPIKKLLYGLFQIENGNLNYRLVSKTNDEIGYLVSGFNKMVFSLKEKNEKIEEYTNHLEEKVRERTRELEESLKEIALLKEKQDGDYFLTSLLVQPLNRNLIESEELKVDFYIDQFKKFNFKRWKGEIGGDFVCAYDFTLRGKKYSFITNADAMGKSIQGAGGALILGSVLSAILERTKYQDEVKNLFPEKWLKYAFVEAHRVIESLNGSMLISLCMILIDNQTGFCYFINAEHPDLVLYRKNTAMFLKPVRYLNKLGVYSEGLISISTIKLQSGDILIMGSDGKDDIVLEKQGNEIKEINTDEKMFLKIVENSGGDLKIMIQHLKEIGEFRDDVSIVRIEYKGNSNYKQLIRKDDKLILDEAKAILSEVKNTKDKNKLEEGIILLKELEKEYPFSSNIKKLLARYYLEKSDFRNLVLTLENIFELEPNNETVLFKIILLLKKMKFYSRAAEFGELYLLRNIHKDILEILIEIYKKIDNPKYKRLEKFLSEVTL